MQINNEGKRLYSTASVFFFDIENSELQQVNKHRDMHGIHKIIRLWHSDSGIPSVRN